MAIHPYQQITANVYSSTLRLGSDYAHTTVTLIEPYLFTAYATASCSAFEGRAEQGRIIMAARDQPPLLDFVLLFGGPEVTPVTRTPPRRGCGRTA